MNRQSIHAAGACNYLLESSSIHEHQQTPLSYSDKAKGASFRKEFAKIQQELELSCDTALSALRNSPSPPEIITTKRFMPDGTIITTTKKEGKIVEQHKKKPHLVPVPDALTGKVKLEPFQSIFELMG